MVRLRVKRAFFDREAGVYRASGQEFEASDARARVILAAGVAEVVGEVPSASPEAPEQSHPATRRRRGGRRKG